MQVCTLLYALGNEAENIVKTFVYVNNGDGDVYEFVLDKLDKYFMPKVDVIHKSARFHQWTQKHCENLEEYIRSLHDWQCDFGIAKNENITLVYWTKN